MSIAVFPRLYFHGEMSWDPSLSNNFENVHDPIKGTITLPPNTTLAELRSRLAVSQPRSWNHYGTHSVRFESVRVTGWSRDRGALAGADPVVGLRVGLQARLVDNNPLMDHGTQLFFDKLVVGDQGQGFEAKRDKRLFARFLNFARNRTFTRTSGRPGSGPASAADATWEVCFPKANLTPKGNLESPALQALFALVNDPSITGLCARFRVYRTLYYQNGIKNALPQQPRNRTDLAALYGAGQNFSNPVYSVVCGAIMPWRTGELVGHPAGRFLRPRVDTGVAFAEVEPGGQHLTLDFGSAIPEEDETLVKHSYGDLDVVATADGTEHVLRRLTPADYDRAAYEAKGGLIDIDLSAASAAARSALDTGALSIRATSGNLFEEQEYVVAVEDRDVYLDQGERADIAVRVLQRGRLAPQGTVVHVAKYGMDLRFVDEPVPSLNVDATGAATLPLAAAAPGCTSYVLVAAASGSPAPSFGVELDSAIDFHANLRALPFDDQLEASTPDSQLTWEWIYEHVLAFWDTQNPVMSRRQSPAINKSLNDRSVVESMTGAIRAVCARNAVEALRYMPPTRDLSAGKRRLLLRWCDLVDSGTAPEASAQPLDVRFHSSDPRTL